MLPVLSGPSTRTLQFTLQRGLSAQPTVQSDQLAEGTAGGSWCPSETGTSQPSPDESGSEKPWDGYLGPNTIFSKLTGRCATYVYRGLGRGAPHTVQRPLRC